MEPHLPLEADIGTAVLASLRAQTRAPYSIQLWWDGQMIIIANHGDADDLPDCAFPFTRPASVSQ